MKTVINTDRRTFLIKFSWKRTEGQFIFQSGEKSNPAQHLKIIK